MKNLAGVADCDTWIRGELDEAGVERVTLEQRLEREVRAGVVGKLGPFSFERAWYYWSVSGPVPLEVAEELYADPVGKTDVRVGGHCACPAPSKYGVAYYDGDGFRLYSDSDGSEAKRWAELLAEDPGLGADRLFRFVKDAKAEAASAAVNSYHIDTQAGLNLFAQTMRRHGLDRVAA